MTSDGLILDIGIRSAPERTFAGLTHIGPCMGDHALFASLFARALAWADACGALMPSSEQLALYHNDPEVSHPERTRISAGFTVSEGVTGSGDIEILKIPGGHFAVAAADIRIDQYPLLWRELLAGWLPRSGWKPLSQPPFEITRSDPREDPQGRHRVELWIPVRSL